MRQNINFYFYKLSVREAWRSSKTEFYKLDSYSMYELLAWEEERIKEDEKKANKGKTPNKFDAYEEDPEAVADFNRIFNRSEEE